jgi:phage shock protein PspC (stress-responsive transcriptional regulator)
METFIWAVLLPIAIGVVLRLVGVTCKDPHDTEFFGVCEGIAKRLNIKPSNIRVICLLLLAFYGWKVFVGYLIVALILPNLERVATGEGESAPKVEATN